nr:hypothetical protein [Tanacetum cinerariifolium]
MPEDPYAYVVAAFQALPSPDYVPGLEEPEQAPPSPVYISYVPEPEYPEYIPPEDEVFPAEEQPLPAAASPTTDLPGYIHESDPNEDPEDDDDEDPEKDPADYPANHDDDDEEEPSGDDADEEDEEQDEDDDDEEKDHPAYADSIPPSPALRVTAKISFRPQPPTLSFTKEDAERFLAMPIPTPSPLTSLSSPLPQIPSPPLPASPPILSISLPTASPPLQLLSSDRRADRPEVTLPPQKREDYRFVGSVEAEIRQRIVEDIGYGIRDTWIDLRDVAEEEALTTLEGVNTRRVEALVDDSQYHYETGRLVEQEAIVSREAWAHSIGLSLAVHFELQGKMAPKRAAPRRTTRLNPGATSNPNQAPSTSTTTVTNAHLQAMIDQGVNVALTARDANRTGDDSHTPGTGIRRTERDGDCFSHKQLLGEESGQVCYMYSFGRCSDVVEFPYLDESVVTYTDISSPFEELSDIGSPRADDHEHFELPEMLEDPYVEVALQAPPSPDYIPGLEEPE